MRRNVRASRPPSAPALAVLLVALLGAAGCATRPAPPPSLEDDPLEEQNRSAHQLNKALDSSLYGPASRGYGAVVPEPARNGVTNLVNHSRLPHGAIQYALQGRPVRMLETSMRFAINTVFGFGGLLDPAAEMGLPFRETNVDETLHVWGVPAGGYWELPAGGPGTQRDWIGYGIDTVADPAFYLTGGLSTAVYALRAVDLLHDRYKLDPAVEALLYESADSYTAQRISYLQNMTARLQGGGTALETLEDPYADY